MLPKVLLIIKDTSTTDGLHIDNSKGGKFYNNILSSIKNSEKK